MTNLHSDSVNLGSNPSPPTSKPLEIISFSETPPRSARTLRNARSHNSGHSIPDDGAAHFDESGWERRLDSGDYALIPPDSDRALYGLLAVMLIGLVMLFWASANLLLGDDNADAEDAAEMSASEILACAQAAPCEIKLQNGKTLSFRLVKPEAEAR